MLIGNLNGAIRPGRFLEFPTFGQPGNPPIKALDVGVSDRRAQKIIGHLV